MPGNQTPFAFVMPLIHPDGKNIADYEYVEKSLLLTLTSLTSQEPTKVPVVVVCHRKPAWHEDFSDIVKFLVIPEHPWFTAEVRNRFAAKKGDRRHVFIDMGLKLLAGTCFALQEFDPKYIMLMDADDFVRTDLVKTGSEAADKHAETECFLIKRGYHVVLEKAPHGFALQGAFELDHYDETCGTCRFYNGQNFRKKLQEKASELLAFGGDQISDSDGNLQRKFLDCLGDLAEGDIANEDSFVRLIGRHTQLDVMFSTAYVDVPLAAKVCGHGNHMGMQGGGVHWRKLYKLVSSRKFMKEFGISDTPLLTRALGLSVKIWGLRRIYRNRQNQRS